MCVCVYDISSLRVKPYRHLVLGICINIIHTVGPHCKITDHH